MCAVTCRGVAGEDAAKLDEEREESARAKAWIRKAKMRRVLADLEETQEVEAKIPRLFTEDNDSQHIMGLLQVRALGGRSMVH